VGGRPSPVGCETLVLPSGWPFCEDLSLRSRGENSVWHPLR
jgi:hypothetical protein